MSANKLKFNQQKTEVFVCRPSCSKEGVPVDTLAVGEARILFFKSNEVVGGTIFSLIRHWRSRFFLCKSLRSTSMSLFDTSGPMFSQIKGFALISRFKDIALICRIKDITMFSRIKLIAMLSRIKDSVLFSRVKDISMVSRIKIIALISRIREPEML